MKPPCAPTNPRTLQSRLSLAFWHSSLMIMMVLSQFSWKVFWWSLHRRAHCAASATLNFPDLALRFFLIEFHPYPSTLLRVWTSVSTLHDCSATETSNNESVLVKKPRFSSMAHILEKSSAAKSLDSKALSIGRAMTAPTSSCVCTWSEATPAQLLQPRAGPTRRIGHAVQTASCVAIQHLQGPPRHSHEVPSHQINSLYHVNSVLRMARQSTSHHLSTMLCPF